VINPEGKRATHHERVYFLSTASLFSVSISEFRCFAALIIAEHQASLPLADMSSTFAFIAEKKASSATFIARRELTLEPALPSPEKTCGKLGCSEEVDAGRC
jgi:hypothetical protein